LQKTHWWGQPAWGIKIGMMKGRVLDAGSSILDTRFSIGDSGDSMLDTGFWFLVTKIRYRVEG